ncbi:hypothetical protein OM416_24290 [Paenibacillus sp. LS1]|uniref:hypothetical protein n=1 Tax=Paenibacillus sp. LS1 TaxID=2992120 RepID=UPI00223144E6|nr:hypothetical protein [Paenibacillus sp. LS1]MCW3794722.1 hypothetical protein [Paenibacillus sp. LS1]
MIASCDVGIQREMSADPRISSMEIIRYDMQRLPCIETEHVTCYCGLFKISCGETHGFAEFKLSEGAHPTDLVHWASVFRRLRGMQPTQAIRHIEQHREIWGNERVLFVEEAVRNLLFNLETRNDGSSKLSREEIRTFLMHYALTYYSF